MRLNAWKGARRALPGLALAFAAACAAFPAWANDAPPAAEAPPALATPERIRAELEELDALPGLEEAVRARAQELLQQALDELRRAAEWNARAAEFDAVIAGAPERLEEYQARLAAPPPAPDPETEVPEDATLAALDQAQARLEADLAAARTAVTEIETRLNNRSARRRLLPDLIAATRQRIEELRAPDPAAVREAPELMDARLLKRDARRIAAEAELASYEKELASFDVRGQLLGHEYDLAVRRRATLEDAAQALRERVVAKRADQAEDAREQAVAAVMQVAEASPVVRQYTEDLASEIADLTELRAGPAGMLRAIERTEAELQEVSARRERLANEFATVRQKVDAAGLTNAMGLLLRRHRAELPNPRTLARNVRARQQTISEVELQRIELRDARRAVADIDRVVNATLAELPDDIPEEQRDLLAGFLRDLLQSKRTAINMLLQDSGALFDGLVNLDAEERGLAALTSEFIAYIDEHVLWIQSTHPVSIAEWDRVRDAAVLLADPEIWLRASRTLRHDAGAAPVQYAGIAALLLALAGFRYRLIVRRRAAGENASKAICTSFEPTFETFVQTLLLAMPAPLAAVFLGWRLAGSVEATEFGRALGAALQFSGLSLFVFAFARQCIRPGSLGDAHFGWPSGALRRVHRGLGWLGALVAPTFFVVGLLQVWGQESAQGSLGRLFFLVMMAGLLLFSHLLFSPDGAIVREWMREHDSGAFRRVRRLLHLAGMALPIALLSLSASGYHYTAVRLGTRLFVTAALGLALLLLSQLVLRWLMLAKRRLAMEQARKRRAALKAKGPDEAEGEAAQQDAPIDLAHVDAQSKRLLRSGLVFLLLLGVWITWSDELPAIGILKRVELPWYTTETLVERVMDPAGEWQDRRVDRPVPVTLAHLVLAGLVGLMTFAAVRNLPGLIEIALLQRIDLAPGERYAITTVMRYALVLIGGAIVFSAIGVGWSKVQWLVAALGVGLGFGLQEIFANFVSGLIILFERPIRVGDTITINGLHGTVTQIRIRATTILDFDRKELVVPNKEFISGQIVNWTLSDSTLRIVVPVGIAYGSDTRRAEELLREIADRHPKVLKDPKPLVYFMDFGDSSLDFELRVYISGLENYMPVLSELHFEIDAAFREAGVEIAFPQRDLHIRSIHEAIPRALAARAQDTPEAPNPSGG